MNKIVVVNDKAENIKLSDNIDFHIETYDTLFSITNMGIEITSDEELYLLISAIDKKYKINIDINQKVCAKIYIVENIDNSKIQYSFTLSEDANLNIKHFNKNNNSKQMIETNLIGANSKFNYNIKKVCSNKETSDFYIHHCGNLSTSNLSGEIVSINQSTFSAQLSTFVEEGCKDAETIQKLNFLKFHDGKTDIKPNLYIDNDTATIEHNNNISVVKEFNEVDFMTNEIYDKELKKEILKRIGGSEDE